MALEFVVAALGKRSCLRIGRGTCENAIWAARSAQRIEQQYPNAKVEPAADSVRLLATNSSSTRTTF